jgi:hypothetical protein
MVQFYGGRSALSFDDSRTAGADAPVHADVCEWQVHRSLVRRRYRMLVREKPTPLPARRSETENVHRSRFIVSRFCVGLSRFPEVLLSASPCRALLRPTVVSLERSLLRVHLAS